MGRRLKKEEGRNKLRKILCSFPHSYTRRTNKEGGRNKVSVRERERDRERGWWKK